MCAKNPQCQTKNVAHDYDRIFNHNQIRLLVLFGNSMSVAKASIGMLLSYLVSCINRMDFTSLSTAHDHLDHVQHLMDDWMQDILDNLRVACEGL
jgi:hypothetical protein